MISIEEAQRIILRHTQFLPKGNVSLLQGLGRVMAENVHAPRDIPMIDNSAMDGYAFSFQTPVCEEWVVVDFIPAGGERTTPVAAGEAVRIMTGAPVPPGCDTVVPFEDVELTPEGIRLTGAITVGANIRRQGEDVLANDLVIEAGAVLRPQEIGLLASLGKAEVSVYRKVRVAIIATGDELLEAGASPAAGRIFNSNSYSLAAQVLEAGGEPLLLGVAADSALDTMEKLREGLQADMVITTGGVSVGDRDFVKETIRELGGKMLFWKVNMKPGKPVAFAILEDKPVFALPGNPVATMVGFEIFVRPAMLRMMGHSSIFRPTVKAILAEQMINRGDRPHLVRVRVTRQHGINTAKTTGNQSSANLVSLTRGNCLLKLEPHTSIMSGSSAEITVLDHGFEMGSLSNDAA